MFWWPQKEFVNSILEFNSTTCTLCESLRCHPTPSKAFTAGKKVKHPLPAQCQHLLEGTPPLNHQNLKAPLHGCKKTQASNFAAACFSKRRFFWSCDCIVVECLSLQWMSTNRLLCMRGKAYDTFQTWPCGAWVPCHEAPSRSHRRHSPLLLS